MSDQSNEMQALLEQYRATLLANEARFRQIIESNADGILIVDQRGAVQYMNPAAEALFSRSSEQMLGQVIGFPLVDGNRTEIDIVRPGNTAGVAEMRVVQTDWDGERVYLASLRDMSQRKQMENELKRLFESVEQSPAIVIITDLNGHIEYVNPQFTRSTGYQRDEVIGRTPGVLKSGHHPPEFYKNLWHTLLNEEVWHGVVCNRKKSGELYWGVQSISPVRNADGMVTHYVSVTVDDTERVQALEARRKSEQNYRQLFETASDAILVADEKGRFLDANPQAEILTGYPRQELLEKSLSDISVLSSGQTQLIFDQFVKEGKWQGEFVLVHKDGRRVETEISASMIGPGRYQSILRDITARKAIEKANLELAVEREKVRVLEEFISNVSHDLKTPFAAIRMSLYLLRRAETEAQRQSHLAVLDRQTSHLEKLFEDMVNMSRLDTATEFEFARLDVNALLHDVLAEQAPLARKKEHELSFITASYQMHVQGDKIQLYRAFSNIITNALHYTPPRGTISVRTMAEVGEVIIEVHDNGIGIPRDDLSHIFERFFRGDRARGTEKGGTGLGLAITSKIVNRHEGRIEVTSEEGKGTTFRIILPLAEWPRPGSPPPS
jgi:PAS domain S-box-containing protein